MVALVVKAEDSEIDNELVPFLATLEATSLVSLTRMVVELLFAPTVVSVSSVAIVDVPLLVLLDVVVIVDVAWIEIATPASTFTVEPDST